MNERATAARIAKDLQMALRAARMVVWEFDPATGKVEYSSSVGAEQIRVCLEDRALIEDVVHQALQSPGAYNVESRVVKPDGNVIWIRNQGEVVRNAEGRPIRVIGIALDITEHKQTDDLLQHIAAGVSAATGEAFFRLLTQQLCVALQTDFACVGELRENRQDTVQTIAMYAAGQFSEGLEYELAGTPCREAIASGHCSYAHSVQSSFPTDHLLVDIGIESYIGVALTGSTGKPVGVMSVMSRRPLKNANQAETILSIFASRASAELERRRSERALRESEFRNRAILNALPDTIFVLDRHGVIQNCYTKDPGELSIRPESIPGEKLEDVLTPEAAGLILQSSTTLEPDRAAVVEYSLPVLGQPRLYEARTVSLGDGNLLSIVREITDRKSAEAALKESRRFAQRIADTTPNVLFIYDCKEGRNTYLNERSGHMLGYTSKEIADMGANITKLMHPDDIALLPAVASEYARGADGEIFEHVVRFKHKNGEWRWIHRSATIFSRTPDGQPKQILGSATDITRFKQAEQELQELSARLLSAQDEERRRIARELHDATGQNLTAIGLHLEALEKTGGMDSNTKKILSDCRKLCSTSQNEIRTLSYLLHPPELDLLGLVGALTQYVEGFERRTGIKVLLDVRLASRLPPELETDLFRVVQEGLTNISRHSGSETAVIRLEKSDGQIILQIEDNGCGLAQQIGPGGQGVALGVGIPGMRERLRQYGGSLEVRSEGHGTMLRGVIPAKG